MFSYARLWFFYFQIMHVKQLCFIVSQTCGLSLGCIVVLLDIKELLLKGKQKLRDYTMTLHRKRNEFSSYNSLHSPLRWAQRERDLTLSDCTHEHPLRMRITEKGTVQSLQRSFIIIFVWPTRVSWVHQILLKCRTTTMKLSECFWVIFPEVLLIFAVIYDNYFS